MFANDMREATAHDAVEYGAMGNEIPEINRDASLRASLHNPLAGGIPRINSALMDSLPHNPASFSRSALMDAAFLRNELNPDLMPDDGGTQENENHDAEGANLNDFGQLNLPKPVSNIHVITIIGQVEGHLVMSTQNKTTKYEHIIPQLVAVEQSPEIEGLLVILNTVGGDVEAGLAIAEMIASLSKPTVSLVLGGGHSIGGPIAVSASTSFIAPSATMTIHPIRLTGMVVGVQQSFDYLERMQDRVINFVISHSHISAEKFRELMMTTGELARDVGTVVVGKDAVEVGLIDRVGGLGEALDCLKQQIAERTPKQEPKTAKQAKNPGKEQSTGKTKGKR